MSRRLATDSPDRRLPVCRRSVRGARPYGLALLMLVIVSAGCSTAAKPWDGKPWTNTHPEPCRRYEPITDDWVRAHPKHPCAQVVPTTTPQTRVELGPACSVVNGEPVQCSPSP